MFYGGQANFLSFYGKEKGKNRHGIIGMGNSAMIWYIEASYTI